MIQSGFQGLTEGKQTGDYGKRKAGCGREEGATDLFDGKLQRCLEGMRRVDSTQVKYHLDALPTSAFPAGYGTHGQPANIYLFRKQNHFLSSLVPHPASSLILSTETVSRKE